MAQRLFYHHVIPLYESLVPCLQKGIRSLGTSVATNQDPEGEVPHRNPERSLTRMARVGGKKVKHHIKKGYEQGRNYDPYYVELNRRRGEG